MIFTKPLDTGHLSPLRRELLSLLRCPEDQSSLYGWDSLSSEGALSCARCGRVYPVRDGIPCLLPDTLREATFRSPAQADATEVAEKQSEIAARDAQAAEYDRMIGLKLFTLRELPLTLQFLAPDSESLLLEGGCGTGRMTQRFAETCRGVVAADFSGESLRTAMRKLPQALREKVLFIQADLSQLPLSSESFDRVGSFGVYEHIPTPAARAHALQEMARVARSAQDGGRFACSAYRWGPPVSWLTQREGHHGGGIYFIRFTEAELRAQIGAHFSIERYTGSLGYYHLFSGRKTLDG